MEKILPLNNINWQTLFDNVFNKRNNKFNTADINKKDASNKNLMILIILIGKR